MKKRLTGIDVHPGEISAVQLKAARKRYKIELAVTVALTEDMDLASALNELFTTHGFSRRAAVSVAPADNQIFLNLVNTALPDIGQIRRVLKGRIEDSVPIPFDDIIADICGIWRDEKTGAGKNVLASAMSRKSLRALTDALDRAGISPDTVCPAASALDTIAQLSPAALESDGFAVLHFDRIRSFAAIYRNGAPALIRAMKPVDPENCTEGALDALIREITLGWQRLSGSTMPDDAPILVSSGSDAPDPDLLQRLPGSAAPVSLSNLVEHERDIDDIFLIPAALALKAARPEYPDFLQMLRLEAKSTRKPVAYIVGACVLLFALAGAGVARLYLTASRLEHVNRLLDRRIEDEFHSILPEEEMIFPAEQMRTALRSLRQRHEGLKTAVGRQNCPVSVLNAFNRNIPEGQRVEVERIVANSRSIQIRGSIGSFGEAEELRRALSALDFFDRVEMDYSSRPGTERVGFDLNVSVSQQ